MRTLFLSTVFISAAFFAPAFSADGLSLKKIGNLPLVHQGRIKPLESAARTTLLLIHGKQTLKTGGARLSALQWFLDVSAKPDLADQYPVFVIHNPDLKMNLGFKDQRQKYFSYQTLNPHISKVMEEGRKAAETDAPQRTAYQRAAVTLSNQIELYFRLTHSFFMQTNEGEPFEGRWKTQFEELKPHLSLLGNHGSFDSLSDDQLRALRGFQEFLDQAHFMEEVSLIRPFLSVKEKPADPASWKSPGGRLHEFLNTGETPQDFLLLAKALDGYREGDAEKFKSAVGDLEKMYQEISPAVFSKGKLESLFHRTSPFILTLILYLGAFLLVMMSWLKWGRGLSRFSYGLVAGAFVLHTVALLTRMYLQGRPPVTNLYSSAVFVGWGAVLAGLILENYFKNRIGTAVASLCGFASLIIAHHLSIQGDTLEVMRAVLDSNFWLATHVVVITIGYSATYLAGFLGAGWIFRSFFTGRQNDALSKDVHKMIFGVVCFGLLFSFVGTVLGGIWADQSWGRFWGWDPKENGALLIVLWNAILLHALRDGLISTKGLAVGAVFGNIITSFAWFGVNMLGVGLHSYGFMDKAFLGLAAFVAANLLIMGFGWLIGRGGKRFV